MDNQLKSQPSKLPEIIKKCTIDRIVNGRSVDSYTYIINWDIYDEIEAPSWIMLCENKNYSKKMLSPQAAIIDGLKIIAEKLTKDNKFRSGEAVRDGQTITINENELNNWIATATNNGKDRDVIYNPQKKEDLRKYINAIKKGKIELVQLFIDNGSKVGRIKGDKEDIYPLRVALESNQPTLVNYFIDSLKDDYSLDGNKPNGYSYFSIIAQQFNQNAEQQIMLLLENGYDLKKDTYIPANLDSLYVNQSIMTQIIESLDPTQDDGMALIGLLKRSDDIEIKIKNAYRLIERGFNIHKLPTELLILAATETNVDFVKYLVNKGIDPNKKNKSGDTPLEAVLYKSTRKEIDINIIHYLYNLTDIKPDVFEFMERLPDKPQVLLAILGDNFDYNAKSKNGITLVEFANENWSDKTMIDLLYKKADSSFKNDLIEPLIPNKIENLSRLFEQFEDDFLAESLLSVLDQGSDPDLQDEDGNTLLHNIIEHKDKLSWTNTEQLLTNLIDKKANVNIQNKVGLTPLMLAAQSYKSILEIILTMEPDLNLQDIDGNTAIHLACKSALLPLLQAKPNLLIKNKKGLSAIDKLRKDGIYTTEGIFYQDEIAAINALGLSLPTDQELKGVKWESHAIDVAKQPPAKWTRTSTYYFPFNDGSDGLFYLGNNLLALIGGYPRVIQIFDTQKGQVIWGLQAAAYLGFAIYDEDRQVIYVARDGYSSAHYITAHQADTGQLIWTKPCKLTNSRQQFGTLFVQNRDYLIHANITKKVLFLVNKESGKLDGKIEMVHRIDCNADFTTNDVMFTHDNQLYVFSIDDKNDLFCIDKYHIDSQSFIETIFKSKAGCRLLSFIHINENLYLLSNSGVVCQLSLSDGTVISQVPSDEQEGTPNNYHLYSGLSVKNQKIYYALRSTYKNGEITYYIYDMATGKIKRNGADLIDDTSLNYKVDNWMTIQSIQLGDAKYEVQKQDYCESSNDAYLHQLL